MEAHPNAWSRRGWLTLLALAHVVLLLMSIAALPGSNHRLSVVEHPIWGERNDTCLSSVNVETCVSIVRLCAIALGMYLVLLLVRGDRRWPGLFVGYGVACLVIEAALPGWYFFWGWDSEFDFPWWRTLGGASVIAAALLYVARSGRLRATFDREPPAIGFAGRAGIGLVAALVMGWPFVMNCWVDEMQALSGRFSLKDQSAGLPLASAILAVSLGGGLFVLMKHAWRMKNPWIAILPPLGFMTLVVTYGILSFVAHFGR